MSFGSDQVRRKRGDILLCTYVVMAVLLSSLVNYCTLLLRGTSCTRKSSHAAQNLYLAMFSGDHISALFGI